MKKRLFKRFEKYAHKFYFWVRKQAGMRVK